MSSKTLGKIRISPSAIKTWRQCQRLWAFNYIDKVPRTSSPKADFGTLVHRILEVWLGKAVEPPVSAKQEKAWREAGYLKDIKADPLLVRDAAGIAMQGIKKGFLPTPDASLILEHKFEIHMPQIDPRAYFLGIIDLLDPPNEDLFRMHPAVKDHKTTGDIRYALDWEKLSKDPQGLIYAFAGMEKYGVDVAMACWIYYVIGHKKNGRKVPKGTRKVEHVFDRTTAEFQDPWGVLLDDCRAIVHAKDNWKKANEDAECSISACHDFGGCPMLPQCDRPQGSRVASYMTQFDTPTPTPKKTGDPMSFLDDVKNGTADTPKTPAPEPAPAPDAEASSSNLLARLQGKGAAVGVNPEPPVPTPPEDPAPESGNEATPAEPPAETKPEDGKEPCPTCDKTFKRLAMHKCPNAEKAQVEPAPEDVADHQTHTATDAAAIAKEEAEALASPTTKPIAKTLMLVIDGYLRKGNVKGEATTRELAEWVAPIAELVAKANDVEHWGLIDFAKGAPLLEAKVKRYLETDKPTGVLYLDSGSLEGRALKSVMIEAADLVFQGTR